MTRTNLFEANAVRNGSVDKVVERLDPDILHHHFDIRITGADVPARELSRVGGKVATMETQVSSRHSDEGQEQRSTVRSIVFQQ